MHGDLLGRVSAAHALDEIHLAKAVAAGLQEGEVALREILLEHDVLEPAVVGGILQGPPDPVDVQIEPGRDPLQVRRGSVGSIDHRRQGDLAVCNGAAMAVQDVAAGRCDGERLDAVLARLFPIALVIDYLDLPE